MLQRILAIITGASLCLLILLLSMTTPATAGPLGLLVIFLSAYLFFLGLISFFLFGTWHGLRVLGIGKDRWREATSISFRRAYYYGTVLAAAPVMLLGLQSVGTIGWYELLLVALFAVFGCIYISKRM